MNSLVWILALFASTTCIALQMPAGRHPVQPASVEAYVLPNGLRVVLFPDPAATLVGVAVSYAVGSNDDPASRSGLVHFLEHLAISDADGVTPSEQWREVNAAGGSHTSIVWDNRTEYRSAAPKPYLERLLWFEAQRMTPLSQPIPASRLDRIRLGIRIEHARLVGRPFTSVSQQLRYSVYPTSHPYRQFVIGDIEQAFNASEKEIREFSRDRYAPSNAVLAVTGQFATATAKAMITRYFGPLKRQRTVATRQITPVVLAGDRALAVLSRIESPTVIMFWPISAFRPDDRPARTVLLNLLNQRKVANFVMTLGGIQAEAIVPAAADQNQVQSGLIELVESFSQASNELIALDEARDTAVRRAEVDLTAVDLLGLALANAWREMGAPDYALTLPERIRGVSAADIRRVAQSSFGAGHASVFSTPDKRTAAPLGAVPLDSRNPLVGTWEGEVKEAKRSYRMEMLIERLTAGKPAGRTRYFDGADCGASLQYLGASGDGLHSFLETIDTGRGCWGGLVEVRLAADGTLEYHLRNGQAPPLAWTDPPRAKLKRNLQQLRTDAKSAQQAVCEAGSAGAVQGDKRVGRSLTADRPRTAKTVAKPGHGDQRNPPRAATKKK
jgi:predicted Zn-dependent peptidase